MCALGLYLAFLLLEDMIVGNYSTNTTQDHNLPMEATYNTFLKNLFQQKNMTKRSIGKQDLYISNIATTSVKPSQKLQTGHVTQKKYELINMLFRKSMIVVDEGNVYTATNRINATKMMPHKREYKQLKFSSPSLPMQTTTSSKIEFYYMDDNQHIKNINNCTTPRCKSYKMTEGTSRLPFLIFHLKGPYVDPIPLSSTKLFNHTRLRSDQVRISGIRLKEVQELPRKVTVASILTKVKNKVKTTRSLQAQNITSPALKYFFFNNNALIKRAIPTSPNLNRLINHATVSSYANITESSTIYDKIKFFEIYDQFTHTPYEYTIKKFHVKANHTDRNLIDNNEKILLEHVDQSGHDHVQAKLAKKHVTDTSLKMKFLQETVSKSKTNDTHKKQGIRTSFFMNGNKKSEPNNTIFIYVNETARWSDYPFTAVYIYEPSQVHCDAAAINRYWLIASGSCLSRVSSKVNFPFEPYGEGQSAFVVYCGDQWWQPERVAYVKYTVVHPKYHARDKTRQHLYNIGAIQVVNSMMSACAGWAPVALMSHQFSANADTTWAMAVGWGLDRYDTRYGATDLPKTHLTAYKSVVYFDSCPGNVGYSKAKRLDEDGGVRNVHCLSLPPYYGEDADPVHGGLLLADGKLIALYLQEERRPWGDQSAQYTGVWRLIPWLMDIAREPEQIDTIIFEL